MDKEKGNNLNTFVLPKNKVNSNSIDNSSEEDFFLDKEVLRGIKRTLNVRDVVKVLCRERAMKLVDLARDVGLSKQSLNNYIAGRFSTPTQIKIKIAQVLGVDSSVIWDLK